MFQPQRDTVRTKCAAADDLSRVLDFYRTIGHSYEPRPTDHVVIALQEGQIVGAARLAEESGTLMLRGVRVAPERQREGIGTKLVKECMAALNGRECWSIAYRHLEGFYGREGFVRADANEYPPTISERMNGFAARGRKDLIAVRRAGREAQPPF